MPTESSTTRSGAPHTTTSTIHLHRVRNDKSRSRLGSARPPGHPSSPAPSTGSRRTGDHNAGSDHRSAPSTASPSRSRQGQRPAQSGQQPDEAITVRATTACPHNPLGDRSTIDTLIILHRSSSTLSGTAARRSSRSLLILLEQVSPSIRNVGRKQPQDLQQPCSSRRGPVARLGG